MKSLLFLDNWMIEKQVSLERVWHQPRFVKEIFDDYPPNMLGFGGCANIFWDERSGKYMLYTDVYVPDGGADSFGIRLESDNPYEWENPVYDTSVTPAWKGFERVVVDEKGRKYRAHYINSLAGTPFADRGYLMNTFHPDREKNQSIAGFSEDGLHFDTSQTRPWQQTRSDTWCGWIWNERGGFFQIHTRPVHVDRRVAVVTTTDFEHFTPAVTVLQPDVLDPPGTEIYSMPADPYEDMFIGLPHLFSTDLFDEGRRVKMGGRMETHLSYSYNGLNWYRTPRVPFIPTREYGELGGGQNYGVEMLRTREDKLLFLTYGSLGDHYAFPDMQKAGISTRGAYGLMLYDMRLDGFCSFKTRGKDGLLRTKSIIPQSGEMSLNVRTNKHTALRVQLLDGETGEPIPGYTLEEAVPITGDQLFVKPVWKNRKEIAELVGRPIRVEIMMREAEIFAIRVPCQVYIGTEPTDDLA